MSTDKNGNVLLPSDGYKKLKSFKLARLIYDITVHFVELYIPAKSRTCDQMVQAARSGVQNIAEGSVIAATSAKLEINLYNVARGSLEELKLDYQDYLRQNNEKIWQKNSPLYDEFIRRKIAAAVEFKSFIEWAENIQPQSVNIRKIPYKSVLVANAVLLLIDTVTYFLKKQMDAKIKTFVANGGFSENMLHARLDNRNNGGNQR